MTPERWQEIKKTVKRQDPQAEEGREDLLLDTAEGQIKTGEAEFIIFSAGGGSAFGGERLKLQFQKKPRVEEKKFHYSHRQGDSARVEYKFSESDMVYTLKAYKLDDMDEWKEIDSSSFGR